jgi:hypothetical protein
MRHQVLLHVVMRTHGTSAGMPVLVDRRTYGVAANTAGRHDLERHETSHYALRVASRQERAVEKAYICIAITICAVADLPEPAAWAAPLPDFSQAAINHRIRIGAHVFRITISSVQRDVPREPETELVQIGVFYGDRPLTAADLGLESADACANVWAFLTNRLNETAVQFYSPRPRPTGELNPRLGCWGPRPDLVEAGLGESDCAIAVVLGLSIWLPGASPPVDDGVFLEALRDTVVESLSYWVVVAQKTVGPPRDRRN